MIINFINEKRNEYWSNWSDAALPRLKKGKSAMLLNLIVMLKSNVIIFH